MDPHGIRKCMSLGYSSKKSNTTIGQCKLFFYKFVKRLFLVTWLLNFRSLTISSFHSCVQMEMVSRQVL